MEFWQTELTEEETEALIEKAANEISRRNLQTPVILALEMHKPLANVGGQAAIVFAPFMVPILGFDFVNDYSRLLSNKENVERLIRRLENPGEQPEELKEK
jgi:uncharacterized protein (DUF1778 family)